MHPALERGPIPSSSIHLLASPLFLGSSAPLQLCSGTSQSAARTEVARVPQQHRSALTVRVFASSPAFVPSASALLPQAPAWPQLLQRPPSLAGVQREDSTFRFPRPPPGAVSPPARPRACRSLRARTTAPTGWLARRCHLPYSSAPPLLATCLRRRARPTAHLRAGVDDPSPSGLRGSGYLSTFGLPKRTAPPRPLKSAHAASGRDQDPVFEGGRPPVAFKPHTRQEGS